MPPNQRPTIKDVATAAGVSPQAVSLVINRKNGVSEETRHHIERIIKELNYTPHAAAQAMRNASTRTLAFIYAGTQSGRLSASGYLEEILNGVLASANLEGYHLLLYSLQFKSDNQLKDLSSRCDGIIAVGSHLGDEQMALLESLGLPIVEIQRRSSNAYSVCVDDEMGICSAVTYLSRRGHKRIAYLSRSLTKHTSKARYQGYLKGLKDNRLDFDPSLVRHAGQGDTNTELSLEHPLEYKEVAQGLELSLDLLNESPPPSAIICFDDLLAVGALRAAKLRNLTVPSDLAVIGFNNFSMAAATTPPLTTLGFPAYQLGIEASNALIRHLKQEKQSKKEIVLPVKLFVRESA